MKENQNKPKMLFVINVFFPSWQRIWHVHGFSSTRRNIWSKYHAYDQDSWLPAPRTRWQNERAAVKSINPTFWFSHEFLQHKQCCKIFIILSFGRHICIFKSDFVNWNVQTMFCSIDHHSKSTVGFYSNKSSIKITQFTYGSTCYMKYALEKMSERVLNFIWLLYAVLKVLTQLDSLRSESSLKAMQCRFMVFFFIHVFTIGRWTDGKKVEW